MNAEGQVKCNFCNGFYDFGSDQPVCSTCHAFVYDFSTDSFEDSCSAKEKEASNDSGNEEPERVSDFFPLGVSQENLRYPPNTTTPTPSVFHTPAAHPRPSHRTCPYRQQNSHGSSDCYRLSVSDQPLSNPSTSYSLESLPVEVLLRIVDYLDDVSVWTLRVASQRCCCIIDSEIPEQRWAEFVAHRWPIFVPRYRVSSWRLLYLNMMESVTCRLCLSRLHSPVLFPVEGPDRRFRRIVSEIKSLCADPPYGIKAMALDTATYAHCLAGIAGPPGSPYEGGLFYVHILIPDSHPMRPPVIRFLTRILHPNISFHGDIGLDCIRHNWSLALTLDKLLLSVQSLLTDPYTKVCMEPAIGALYNRDRDKFEELAKLWTWKFACHDYLSTSFVSQVSLPDFTTW
ncbi:hypothetical protein SprV_0100033100 [Sparganum proliferum]